MFSIDTTTWRSPNSEPRPKPISAIVIHHGAGTRHSDLSTLCSPTSGVSSHYYVCRDGTIYQLVDDTRRAWHAGVSALAGEQNVNDFSIGIETEHTTDPAIIARGAPRHTDWPPVQLDAIAWLVRTKAAEYPRITEDRTVSHRDVALPDGRKIDPSDPPLGPEPAFRAWVHGVFAPDTPPPTPTTGYTADSPILGTPQATVDQATRYVLRRPTGEYTAFDVGVIVKAYFDQATGVDPVLAVAQMIHETGNLTSQRSQRPQRNPAGIGASNDGAQGLSFPSWAGPDGSIAAHIGRLLAYALTDTQLSAAQRPIVQRALQWRGLPPELRGSAPTLKALGAAHNPVNANRPRPRWEGWAVPGDSYGDSIAAIANEIRGMSA